MSERIYRCDRCGELIENNLPHDCNTSCTIGSSKPTKNCETCKNGSARGNCAIRCRAPLFRQWHPAEPTSPPTKDCGNCNGEGCRGRGGICLGYFRWQPAEPNDNCPEKWNENVEVCSDCGIEWKKIGKQCPSCYAPAVPHCFVNGTPPSRQVHLPRVKWITGSLTLASPAIIIHSQTAGKRTGKPSRSGMNLH